MRFAYQEPSTAGLLILKQGYLQHNQSTYLYEQEGHMRLETVRLDMANGSFCQAGSGVEFLVSRFCKDQIADNKEADTHSMSQWQLP